MSRARREDANLHAHAVQDALPWGRAGAACIPRVTPTQPAQYTWVFSVLVLPTLSSTTCARRVSGVCPVSVDDAIASPASLVSAASDRHGTLARSQQLWEAVFMLCYLVRAPTRPPLQAQLRCRPAMSGAAPRLGPRVSLSRGGVLLSPPSGPPLTRSMRSLAASRRSRLNQFYTLRKGMH